MFNNSSNFLLNAYEADQNPNPNCNNSSNFLDANTLLGCNVQMGWSVMYHYVCISKVDLTVSLSTIVCVPWLNAPNMRTSLGDIIVNIRGLIVNIFIEKATPAC